MMIFKMILTSPDRQPERLRRPGPPCGRPFTVVAVPATRRITGLQAGAELAFPTV